MFFPGLTLAFAVNLPPAWQGYARDAQHGAVAPAAAQPVNAIHWHVTIDKYPEQYVNLEHYPSPVITAANTVIVAAKLGVFGNFQIIALRPGTGQVVWNKGTDYAFPPDTYYSRPTLEPFLTRQNKLYYAGIAGTIYERDNPDRPNVPSKQYAFYGMSNYKSAPVLYGLAVQINTPLTGDAYGNIYFGFRVSRSNPLGLKGGIARIDPNGNGTWISAASAAGNPQMIGLQMNSAPAISRDGSTVYAAVSNGDTGYLLGLDSQTLQTKYKVLLVDPEYGGAAELSDSSSASPTVGPNGDVYFGVLSENGGGHHARGWLLHFNYKLDKSLIPGSFGWDDTASLVPPNTVPSYKGTSPYLLLTKYNNYLGAGGGDGMNKVAVLDPYVTEVDPYSGLKVMNEVITVLGPTPNPEGGVYEWCVNTVAVDPFTKSALVNSEDGNVYRWDFTTNTLTQKVDLGLPVAESYTPTVIGPDGTNYALSNGVVYAIGR